LTIKSAQHTNPLSAINFQPSTNRAGFTLVADC